jgi:hypothetical protein
MNHCIHIVSFDVPLPPDYGGVLDVYLRLKALKNLGYSIILHCFEYGRGRSHDFSKIADVIHYYDRKTGFESLLSKLPYIVKSRNSEELITRLMQDQYPIILEGQHCTYWARELVRNHRLCAIRMHNVEWHYYRDLAQNANRYWKNLYFRSEARKLKKQEIQLKEIPLLCISESDLHYYLNMGFQAYYLPTTIDPDSVLTPVTGKTFALFHGNLSVLENQAAIDKLIEENKRSKLPIPVVIAGKNPGSILTRKIQAQGWECIPNPCESELNDLMRSCSLHLLIGFQTTGLKLKVIRALLTGKPCIATQEMVQNPVLEKQCIIWDPVAPLAELLIGISSPGEDEIKIRLHQLDAEFGIEKLKTVMQQIGFSQALC